MSFVSTMKIMNILILYVVLFVLSTVVAVQAADGNLVEQAGHHLLPLPVIRVILQWITALPLIGV